MSYFSMHYAVTKVLKFAISVKVNVTHIDQPKEGTLISAFKTIIINKYQP